MKRKEKRNKFLKAESGFPQSLRMTEEITKNNKPSIFHIYKWGKNDNFVTLK